MKEKKIIQERWNIIANGLDSAFNYIWNTGEMDNKEGPLPLAKGAIDDLRKAMREAELEAEARGVDFFCINLHPELFQD